MTDADRNIEIEVNTRYLQEHSDPTSGRYAFAYTIDILSLIHISEPTRPY